MSPQTRHIVCLTLACVPLTGLAGCRRDRAGDRTTGTTVVREETVTRETRREPRRAALDDSIVDLEKPTASGADEAKRIQAFRDRMTRDNLTYTITTYRATDGRAVTGASTLAEPVRAEVTVFRGREVLRTFDFVPRDNRNLALLGQ